MAKVELFLQNCSETVGEAPHWDDRTGQLLYVDIFDNSVHRWTEGSGIVESYKFESTCSLVVPCKTEGYLVSVGQNICHFNWEKKEVRAICRVDEEKNTKINDGKCDALGRLWFGTYGVKGDTETRPKDTGSLFSLDTDGTVKTHKTGIVLSNGMTWTNDNRTMFYTDSLVKTVWAYDFDLESGTISNERTILSFGKGDQTSTLGLPDGMTIDKNDKLWLACYLTGQVKQYDPETGKQIGFVSIPAKRATSCCFGGKNFDELYITSAKQGADAEELKTTPLAGSLFKATGLGTSGKAAYIYKGLI